MPLEANTTISHYKILHSLGAGGMGEVYLAEDGRLRRKVALKVLPDTLARDAERLRRFEQEALAASALNHPNILTIFEFGEEGGTHYLASEFIDGETLRERLQRGPLSVNETLEVVIQTVQALSAAHEAGIIHRDIKPENVMLRKDGFVKVLDFGLAKLVETTPTGSEEDTRKQGMTREGTVMGTVAYMSPEQARGKAVDARTDQFSLGVMLYEMLSRRQPFTGETFNHVIVAILEKEPTPLAGIPNELKRILEKALAKNAADRYSDAKAMLGELKKLQTRLLVEAETGGNREEAVADTLIEGRTAIMSPTTIGTPEVAATAPSGQPTSRDTPKQVKWWIATALSLLLAVGGFFGYKKFFLAKRINSIAVMPFENKNSDADTEYLSDGLAESVIFRLTQIPDLKVSPASSVMYYKGKGTNVAKIASELGVDAVMTGRLTKRGDTLSITVELVDARTNTSLWGEQYERKLSELLTTQREIVTEIVGKLQLKLSGESEQKLAKKYTVSDEAYQLYLRGQYHLGRRSKVDLEKALDYYQQAIKLDPNFALAYVGMSYVYNLGTGNAFLPFSYEEGLSRARNAAVRANEIDPNLAEAHTALGFAFRLGWNWPEAEREFKKALEIDPNNAQAHYYYGLFLQFVGRTGESVREIKTAVELEPLALIMNANLAGAYLFDRQGELGLDQAKKTFDLDQNFISGRFWLAHAYCANKKYAETIDFIEKGPSDDVTHRLLDRFLAYAYAKTGRRNEAESILAKYNSDPAYAGSNSAIIYCALGERDKAFAALERGFARKEEMARMKVDPLWDDLRDDPRFKDLLKRMGLPE